MHLAVDRVNKRVKLWGPIFTVNTQALIVYDPKLAEDKVFFVGPANVNTTHYHCLTTKIQKDYIEQYINNQDYINAFAHAAVYAGPAIVINHADELEASNSFVNTQLFSGSRATSVGTYCAEKGHPINMMTYFDQYGTIADTFIVKSFTQQVTDRDFSLIVVKPEDCVSSTNAEFAAEVLSPLSISKMSLQHRQKFLAKTNK